MEEKEAEEEKEKKRSNWMGVMLLPNIMKGISYDWKNM